MGCVQAWMAAAAVATGMSVAGYAAAQEPRLDGVFDEWTPADQVATDPAGDSTGAFDVQRVYAASRGSRLWLRFDTTNVRNLQSGVSGDGTLRIEVFMPNNRRLTVDMRNRRIWRDNNSNLTLGWDVVGYANAPTYAASEFEVSLDLAYFGVGAGDTVLINFSGADTLVTSPAFVMNEAAAPPARRSAERPAGSTLRIVSQNTLQSGILDGSQAPALERIMDAVGADIYCFQEEYDSSAAQIDAFITGVDPLENGVNWTVHKNFDNAIATWGSLIPMTAANSSYAAAVVDFGGGDAVAVFAIHPKCCGYIGSSEDAQRISQMHALAGTLASLRAGTLGAALQPYASVPAIVLGDWNIVGSRTQLDIVHDPSGPNLQDALIPNLIGTDVVTWRGASTGAGSYCPGRLDILTFSRSGVWLAGGFLLDTSRLNAQELSAMGLLAGDSSASDHLTLVADFRFTPPPACPGDADADFQVNFEDITSILANWGGDGPAGDADQSGTVDFADITSALANWGGACP